MLNHLHKGHRSCYEKSTNPELSHCFLELSTVESPGRKWFNDPWFGHPFSTISKGYLLAVSTPKKGQVFAELPSSNLFRTQKGVCNGVKMNEIQSCSCGFLFVFSYFNLISMHSDAWKIARFLKESSPPSSSSLNRRPRRASAKVSTGH